MLSSTCILVSPSASVIELDDPPPPETVAKLKLPEPSVCSTWFALPSAVGNVYALLNLITPASVISNLSVYVLPVLICKFSSEVKAILAFILPLLSKSIADSPVTDLFKVIIGEPVPSPFQEQYLVKLFLYQHFQRIH